MQLSSPAAGGSDPVYLLSTPSAAGPAFPRAGMILPRTSPDGTSLDPAALGLALVGSRLEVIPEIAELTADINRPDAIAIVRSSELDSYVRGEGPLQPLTFSVSSTPHPRQWIEQVSAQGQFLLVIGDTAAWHRADHSERAKLLSQMHMGLISLAVYIYSTGIGYTPPLG